MVQQMEWERKFLPKQKLFMESLEHEILYSGAFGAGKSRGGLEKGLFLSLKYPGNKGAVIRKNFNHLRLTTMETWIRNVCPPEYIKKLDREMWTWTLTNDSQVIFLGLDQKTSSKDGVAGSKVGSLEVGWIFVDETVEITEDEWDMLLGRLRLVTVPIRQIFGATNPGAPSHWLYRRAFLEQRIQMIQTNTLENTFLPQDYIDSLNRFKGINYDRYVLGKWVGAEGLVYGDVYNPTVHIIPPFVIPPEWERIRVVDFGFTNPFVCQWWARKPLESYDPDEVQEWYMYRELYRTQRLVEDHARDILFYTGDERIEMTIADWDAEDRMTLERHGVPTTRAYKPIIPGIQEVSMLLGNNQMFFFEDALVEIDEELRKSSMPTSTADEFAVYQWGGKRLNLNIKELPIDKDNHGMDCVRYLAWYFSEVRQNPGMLRVGEIAGVIPGDRIWDVDGRASVLRERRWGTLSNNRAGSWRV